MAGGFEEHLAILAALPARVEAAALAAVQATLEPVFEASQEAVPVQTGLLKSTGLVQVEPDGADIKGRISYGNSETQRNWGGAQSAGFGAPKGSKLRQHAALIEATGYEIFVHEGVYDSATGTHPPKKYLELPVLDAAPEMEGTMGHAFQAAFEGAI
jgi:hypothetical protein